MLTPEQEKLFRFLFRFGRINSNIEVTFTKELDLYDYEPFTAEDFEDLEGYRGKQTQLPKRAAQELSDFVNEKIAPEIKKTEDMIGEEINSEYFELILDMVEKKVIAGLRYSWYDEENEYSEFNLPIELSQEILSLNPDSPITMVIGKYEGGGDSGAIEDTIEIVTASGDSKLIPINGLLENWIYRNLPGGWEIDNGSDGRILFDLNEQKIKIDHSWNTESRDFIEITNFKVSV